MAYNNIVEMTHGQLFSIFQSSLALAEENLWFNQTLPVHSHRLKLSTFIFEKK